MCGIICYIGKKQAIPILLDGLYGLEYRGYDSAGLTVMINHGLTTIKKKGRIAELAGTEYLRTLSTNIGIAHTRWATHGEPNDVNAHPHMDCHENISVVHNGIIENYSTLKRLLIDEGHIFKSETDSEVLAHLIEKFYDGDLKKAVVHTLNLIEGTFGIGVLHKDHDQIIIAKKGSPLILGIGDNELLAASDSTALIKYTKRVIYLKDNELAILNRNGFSVEGLYGSVKNKVIDEIKWSVEQVEKKGYKHFMLKEIYEQPESIANVLRGRIKDDTIKLTINADVKNIKKIIIVACGTSWHSALIGKYLMESMTRIPVEVDYASEFRYRNPIVNKDDMLIAISQSGETADTIAAIKEAKQKGAMTLGIVNVVGSTIAREVDSGIYLHAGPEIGVASTKAFTSQVAALLLLSLYIRQEQGLKTDVKLINEFHDLPEKIMEVLKNTDIIIKIAEEFYKSKNFLFLGRDINFPVALEGALKLKEISYIHAEGYPAAEMKHGPIALIDENMPVLFIATKNGLSDKILSNIQEVKARKGQTIVVMNKHSPELDKLADFKIIVPQVMNELSPIINAIPLQLLAYYVADMKSLDVDKPRNLAKSVTVE